MNPSWLKEVAAWEGATSSDELLISLLDDEDASYTSLPSTSLHGTLPGPEGVETSPSGSPASSSAVTETTTDAPPPPPKRKRVRLRMHRPKAEIDRLRSAVVDLENLLALAQQRARTGRVPPTLGVDDVASRAEYSANELMWMDIATRQYNYLREAQIANEQLREQVLSQLQIVRSLTRLAQGAAIGVPSEFFPRAMSDPHAAVFARKRKELVAVANEMYDSIEGVFDKAPFNSSTKQLSGWTSYRFKGYAIPPRALLASGSVRQYAPHSAADLGDALWMPDPPRGRGKQFFRVEHIEEGREWQVMQGTVRLPETAEAKCVIVRRLRVWDSTRQSVVIASSLWPSPANESPWNCVGMDTKQWLDVHDVSLPSDDERLAEVRYSTEAYKLSDTKSTMVPIEAGVLVRFVGKAVEFTVNYIHQRVDGVLLGPNRVEAMDQREDHDQGTLMAVAS